jgi:hypothetical protein
MDDGRFRGPETIEDEKPASRPAMLPLLMMLPDPCRFM